MLDKIMTPAQLAQADANRQRAIVLHEIETEKMNKFKLIISSGSNQQERSGSLHAMHAALGEFAGQNQFKLHIHEGTWDTSSYSTAYKGNDMMIGVQAYVKAKE